jgi:ferrous iron transport protein B
MAGDRGDSAAAGKTAPLHRPVQAAAGGITAAIAGNPNCGKSSIFNSLTGMSQSVANYPGVTVERKVGRASYQGRDITLVDLPGTYSLTAYSLDELVARDFVIESRPQVVVDVVDASNLERNLYLTVQLMEMRAPLVVALNMVDVARRRALTIDTAKMSVLLGVPVVETVGNKGIGLGDLLRATTATADRVADSGCGIRPVSYGHEVETEVDRVAAVIAAETRLAGRYPANWLAVKLIERDAEVLKKVRELAADPAAIESAAQAAIAAIERHFGESAETIIAERRYGFAAGVVRECVQVATEARQDVTDKIDAIVCHRVLGPLILCGVMYGLFASIFKIADQWKWLFGNSPSGWVQWFFDDWLARHIAGLAPSMPLLHSLIHDGLIAGVGGVVGFVPLIAVLFMLVAVLEDTGYVARVAFVMDRLLRVFGLQGKSILAMIVSGGLGGGGCAVPGVMATRTLREEKDRLVTMLVAPMMNCGAKMPVYLMLIAAFFSHRRPQVLFVLWIASWVFALSAAWVLRKVLIRGEQTPFVMELPAYHLPTLRGVLLHTWERTWLYLRKAGTIILAINVLVWAAMYFPRVGDRPFDARLRHAKQRQLEGSLAGRLGTAITPVSRLAGFDWRDNIALIGGFAAKEVVIGTMGTAYSMGDEDPATVRGLSSRLAADPGWSPARAAAMMVFVMLYAPCLSTMAVIKRESGKWRWALFSTAFSTTVAFVLAVLVYQVGGALGWGS